MDWKLTLAALLTMAAAVVGATPLKVGLYADKGCRGAGACWWARILDGSPDAELKLLSGEALLGVKDGDCLIRYHNGPIVRQTDPVPPCSNVVVLATMNGELSERGPVTHPMFGTPAAIGCDYGRGRMILFNCHPEIRADTRSLVSASIRALTGVAFRLPQAVSPKGRERVGFVARDLTKEVLKAFLDLAHDPKVFVVPLTKDELAAGLGEVFDRVVEK